MGSEIIISLISKCAHCFIGDKSSCVRLGSLSSARGLDAPLFFRGHLEGFQRDFRHLVWLCISGKTSEVDCLYIIVLSKGHFFLNVFTVDS